MQIYRKALGILFIGVAALFMAEGCKQSTPPIIDEVANQKAYHKGLQVMAKNCASCHVAEPGAGIVVAPSLLEIKNAYLQDFDQQADFVKGMTAFMLRPSVANARMQDAIKQYGMMPDLSMSKQHYDAVATYIFTQSIRDKKCLSPGF